MSKQNNKGKKKSVQKMTGIRKVIITSFSKVTGILCAVAILSTVILFYVSHIYDHALQYYGFSQGDIGKAMTVFTDTRSALRGAIGYDHQPDIDEMVELYEVKKEAFENYMVDVEKCIVTDEGQAAYDEIITALDGYWEVSDAIIKEGAVRDLQASALAQDRAFKELAPRYEKVYNALLNLMNVNVEKGDEIQAQMKLAKILTFLTMLIVVVIACFVSMRIGTRIAEKIQKPLKALGERMNTFAHGDLDSAFPEIDTKDEISDIIDDCKRMAENLNIIISDTGEMLSEMADGNFAVRARIAEKYEGKFALLLSSIRKLNHQLNSTLRQINEASEQVSAGAGQLAESATDLAEGATDQAGAVEELTATVGDVTSISEESTKSATGAAKKAKASAENAGKSRENMTELTVAMGRIMETSREIENIIATIEDIASQTNLLSLNASIEAARAGEAGKGFAVVADQIGRLASDSAQSAVMTKELIEKSLEEIEKGNQIVEEAVEAIGDVLVSMEEFAEITSSAAEGSRKQTEMLEQIEQGIEQISMVVQSNSAASQETSAVSEELSAQAISLREMVAVFKLKEE